MKKRFAILLTLILLTLALPALAENAVDVKMEGESYHLTLTDISVTDGQLCVTLTGFGDTLRMGAKGWMLAGWPIAHYGDEAVRASDTSGTVGSAFTFTFDRGDMPDEVWIDPYDEDEEEVLIWSASGAVDAPDDAAAEAEAPDEDEAESSGDIRVAPVRTPVPRQGDSLLNPEPTEEPAPEPTEEPTPEPTEEPTPEPTEEPTPEPTEEPTPEPTPEPAEATVDDILSALGDETYRATYDALLAGEVVQKGSKGDAARGVQQTLIAFGQDIAADGNVGPKTLAALNAVQTAFGLECTDSVDAAGYEALLPRLLIATDEDAARDLLAASMGDEFDYIRACALEAQGLFFSARQAFEACGLRDWQERADACEQSWPKTGQLYKNPEVKGSAAQLTLKFNSDSEVAMFVKIYTTDGVLARTMFITGNSKATVSLPAGRYVVKDGIGQRWYGEAEAFGSEGVYEVMMFDDYGTDEVELTSGYVTTITVGVKEFNPNADSVGTMYEDWGSF